MNLDTQSKLDIETKIQEAARDGVMVDHDCHLSSEDGCETCERWYEARKFFEQEEIKREISNEN